MALKNYLFSYRYDGKEFSFAIPADSLDEAKGHAKAMAWSRYDGELVATIPAYPGGGFLARAIVSTRNFLDRYGPF